MLKSNELGGIGIVCQDKGENVRQKCVIDSAVSLGCYRTNLKYLDICQTINAE